MIHKQKSHTGQKHMQKNVDLKMKRLRDRPPEAEINDGPIFLLRKPLGPKDPAASLCPSHNLNRVLSKQRRDEPIRDYLEKKKGREKKREKLGRELSRGRWSFDGART